MTVLKLHDDGWLKLPASLQRALGAATGDLLEVVPGEGGLVLKAATLPAAEAAPPALAAAPVVPSASATLPAAEILAPRQRGRPRKVVVDALAPKTPPAISVALPPTLRAVGRRKPRTVQPTA
jgi:hypothetical protein